MHWAREHFQHFEFSVGDTLKVYNYMTLGHPEHGRLAPTEAHDIAAAEGRAWLQRNREAIGLVLAPYDVPVRFWDGWKQHPGFDAAFARLLTLFDKGGVFRDTVLADISDYTRRSGAAPLTSADANLLA